MNEFYNPFIVVDGILIICKGYYDQSHLSIGDFDGIQKIGCLAFKGNQAIEHLYIGENIIDIEAEAFSCCANLKEIIVNENNPRYSSMNGSNCIVDKETNSLILGCLTTKIPHNISAIGPFAFCGQTKLKEIEIPSNVKKLYPYAFDGCETLQMVKMNDGLEEIDECCFKWCHMLEIIYIPKTLKSVHNTAFSVIFDGEQLIDDGDSLIHEIYFSGLKQELSKIFNANELFVLENNLSFNDMVFHCQDGVFSFTNKECDY